jgi:hypothetical protein
VCEGVSYVILLKFKVKAGGNRERYLKGLSSECSGVGLLSSNVTLLIATNNEARLTLKKTIILLNFVGVYIYRIKYLSAY